MHGNGKFGTCNKPQSTGTGQETLEADLGLHLSAANLVGAPPEATGDAGGQELRPDHPQDYELELLGAHGQIRIVHGSSGRGFVYKRYLISYS